MRCITTVHVIQHLELFLTDKITPFIKASFTFTFTITLHSEVTFPWG